MTLFSTLPDDCVQLVFDRVSIRSLLLVRRVCRAWQRHQKLNCRRRKTLILLRGNYPHDVITRSFFIKKFAAHNIDQNGNSVNYDAFIDHNGIRSTEWKKLRVNFLVGTFPNVRTLIIASDRTLTAHHRSFNELITNYSSQLVSLQMYFDEKIKSFTQENSVSIVIGNLINLLNSSSALQHFTLDSPWMLTSAIEAPEFLTRIKEFHFKCYGLGEELSHWLRKYEQEGRLNQLTRINLAHQCSYLKSSQELSAKEFEQWPVRRSVAFIPFCIYEYMMNKDRLTSIIANFASLTTISFGYGCLADQTNEKMIFERRRNFVSLSKLAHFLSPLTRLVLLNLNVERVDILPEPLDSIAISPQLKSIKALELDFGDYIDKDCSMFANELTTFVHIFPNLRSIRVITDARDEIETGRLTQSARDLLAGLKRAYGKDSLEMTMATYFIFPFKL